jgi:hypothetical protein
VIVSGEDEVEGSSEAVGVYSGFDGFCFTSFSEADGGLGSSFMVRSELLVVEEGSESSDFRDFCDWIESFRGLAFMGMDDMRSGMMGGWDSKMLRLGLRCVSVGRDEEGVDVEGRGSDMERDAETNCDVSFDG